MSRSYVEQDEAHRLLVVHQAVHDADLNFIPHVDNRALCVCGQVYPCLAGRAVMSITRLDWVIESVMARLEAAISEANPCSTPEAWKTTHGCACMECRLRAIISFVENEHGKHHGSSNVAPTSR